MRRKHDLRNEGITLEFFPAQNNNFSRRSLTDQIFCSLWPGACHARVFLHPLRQEKKSRLCCSQYPWRSLLHQSALCWPFRPTLLHLSKKGDQRQFPDSFDHREMLRACCWNARCSCLVQYTSYIPFRGVWEVQSSVTTDHYETKEFSVSHAPASPSWFLSWRLIAIFPGQFNVFGELSCKLHHWSNSVLQEHTSSNF